MVAMPKLVGEGFYTYNIRVEYGWKSPRCVCCKDFGHIQEECPKNIGLSMAKNLKKPSQAPRGVLVGPKMGFKPTKQVYRPVSKNSTANTNGNKKKDLEPKKEVSNSNPFYVLNSVENDVDFGTNRGTSNLASKEANPSRSSFWNVKTSKDEGKPLKKFDYPGDHDSEDEDELVDNYMARILAL
ncbi:high affinity nitrate transporter 2.6-like protein [Tanacetum coccineum]